MARTIDVVPGPPGLPLLGNAHQLARTSRLHLTSERWARRYGPIVRVDIGRRRIVGICDPDAINAILRDRPDGFRRWAEQQLVLRRWASPASSRPRAKSGSASDAWSSPRSTQTTCTATSTWFVPAPSAFTDGCGSRPLRTRTGDRTRADLLRRGLTSAPAFGHDLNTLERGENELQSDIQRAFGMIARRVAAPVPYWRWIKLPADRALERSMAELHRTVGGFIAQAGNGSRRGHSC